jgi:hypothetical protein
MPFEIPRTGSVRIVPHRVCERVAVPSASMSQRSPFEEPSSTATAISKVTTAPVRLRSLDELDDDDALAVGRAFSQTSVPLVFSILGLAVAIALGVVTLGMTSAIAVGSVSSVLAGGVGFAGLRRSVDVLRSELGVSADDAKRLYVATAAWGSQRWRRPTTESELRDLGRGIIDRARRTRHGATSFSPSGS